MLAHILSYPLFRLTVVLAVGIVLSDWFFPDSACLMWLVGAWGIAFLGAVVCYPLSRYRWRMLFGCMAYLATALSGGILYLINREAVRFDWAEGRNVYVGTILDVPHPKTKTMQAVVEVEQGRSVSDSIWYPVRRKVMLYWMPDSLQGELACGDRLCFEANISRPVSDADFSGFDYGLYLERQGIGGTAVAFTGCWQRLDNAGALSFRQKALLYREKIIETYRLWGLKDDVQAVVSALTVGDKSELTRELKDSYTAAGTSHILALSGMHVVILALILSWLLYPLRYVPGGRWITGFLIVVFLWSFAFLSGLSPSVIRAVVMYSLCVAASVFTESRFLGVSSVSLAAFLMLVYQPLYLFDVSFQLSFVAVLSLLLIYPFIERLFHFRWKPLNWLWKSMALTMAAQLGTLPFILCYFGMFPTYFLLANLVVTPLSIVILGLALVCLLFGAVPWLVKVLGLSVELLNGIMEWVQGLSGSQITSVYLSPVQAGVFALSLISFLLYLSRRSARRLIGVLCCTNLFLGMLLFECMAPAADYLYFTRAGIYTKRERNVSQLVSETNLYRIQNLQVALANDGRWKNKLSSERLAIDYVYVCKGFSGTMAGLSELFQINYVIFDGSLSDAYRERLKQECRSIGLAYTDITEKGAYATVLHSSDAAIVGR